MQLLEPLLANFAVERELICNISGFGVFLPQKTVILKCYAFHANVNLYISDNDLIFRGMAPLKRPVGNSPESIIIYNVIMLKAIFVIMIVLSI